MSTCSIKAKVTRFPVPAFLAWDPTDIKIRSVLKYSRKYPSFDFPLMTMVEDQEEKGEGLSGENLNASFPSTPFSLLPCYFLTYDLLQHEHAGKSPSPDPTPASLIKTPAIQLPNFHRTCKPVSEFDISQLWMNG